MDRDEYFSKEEEVIYSKSYPQFNWSEELLEQENRLYREDNGEEMPEIPETTFEEFWELIGETMRFEVLPERAKWQDKFIALAKELSEEFRMSIKIIRRSRGTKVILGLDLNQYMNGWLARLIGMADEIYITPNGEGRDITIELSYDIIGVYKKGRLICPDIFRK